MKPRLAYRVASFWAVAFMWAGALCVIMPIAFVFAGVAGLLALSVLHIKADYLDPIIQHFRAPSRPPTRDKA
jgi:hypothetical protein